MSSGLHHEQKYEDKEDLLVWEAFKKGDREAFKYIYQSNIQQLYNYGMKIFHDSDVVEDCIQELFINLWDQRKRLANTNNIHFYLIKALRWKIMRLVESSNKKLRNISEHYPDNSGEVVLPYEDHLINDQLDKEKREQLKIALSQLPTRQKEVIHLIFFNKYSYEEVSQIMSLNVRSVYTLAWKALSNLRKLIVTLLTFVLFHI